MNRKHKGIWMLTALASGVAFLCLATLAGGQEDEILLTGTVVEADWDDEGNVIAVDLETEDDIHSISNRGKGNELLREAHEKISRATVNFIGNVEGGDIYRGTCDVVVCDGFVGNAVLKASEGAADLLVHMLKQEFGRNLRRKLGALLGKGAFRDVKRRSDYSEFGGAPLLGLNGAVIIGHGKSDARAVQNAIRVARDSAVHDIVGKIRERLMESANGAGSGSPDPDGPAAKQNDVA